jgi:hypothetical protein
LLNHMSLISPVLIEPLRIMFLISHVSRVWNRLGWEGTSLSIIRFRPYLIFQVLNRLSQLLHSLQHWSCSIHQLLVLVWNIQLSLPRLVRGQGLIGLTLVICVKLSKLGFIW